MDELKLAGEAGEAKDQGDGESGGAVAEVEVLTPQSAIHTPQSDALLSTVAVAERLGYTDQTVRNWHAAGMDADGADARGRPLFRLETVTAWKKRNRPDGAKGGRRPGAGRKRQWRGSGGTVETPLEGAAREDEEEKRRRAELDAQGLYSEEVQALRQRFFAGEASGQDLDTLAGLPESRGGLTRADADKALTLAKAKREQLDLKIKRGELLDAGEVKEMWAGFVARLASRLDSLPGKAASALAARLRLRPEQLPEAREALEEVVRAARAEFVEAA